MGEESIIQAIIQGGAVGVAALTLLVMYKLLGLAFSLRDNHLGDIMGALSAIGEKLDRLINLAEKK